MKQIQAVLSDQDPDNRLNYERNAEAYIKKLKELDASAKEKFADIPSEKKVVSNQ